MDQYDIFLSYKSDDRRYAERLRSELESRGVRVWIDHDALRPGDLFVEGLVRGLESSRAVGLLVSRASMASNWVKEEYSRALSLNLDGQLQLIPLLFEDVVPPGFLGNRHYVDFRDPNNFDASVEQLIWPGITGQRLNAFFVSAIRYIEWPFLQDEIRSLRHRVHRADYPFQSLEDIFKLAANGERVVAFFDLSENFARPEVPGLSRRNPYYREEIYLEAYAHRLHDWILEIRERTRNTQKEVICVLYQPDDTFDRLVGRIPQQTLERLRHYFVVRRPTPAGEEPSDDALPALKTDFRQTWHAAQRELMRAIGRPNQLPDGG